MCLHMCVLRPEFKERSTKTDKSQTHRTHVSAQVKCAGLGTARGAPSTFTLDQNDHLHPTPDTGHVASHSRWHVYVRVASSIDTLSHTVPSGCVKIIMCTSRCECTNHATLHLCAPRVCSCGSLLMERPYWALSSQFPWGRKYMRMYMLHVLVVLIRDGVVLAPSMHAMVVHQAACK